jgi:hypothetical protein
MQTNSKRVRISSFVAAFVLPCLLALVGCARVPLRGTPGTTHSPQQICVEKATHTCFPTKEIKERITRFRVGVAKLKAKIQKERITHKAELDTQSVTCKRDKAKISADLEGCRKENVLLRSARAPRSSVLPWVIVGVVGAVAFVGVVYIVLDLSVQQIRVEAQ